MENSASQTPASTTASTTASTSVASTSVASTSALPITTISIKIPPYWPSDPALWFSQVEAQFTTRGITSQTTKFAYVVGSLQPEVAQEVRDLLINPPTENPYNTLKAELIKRTSASEPQRLHQLINAEQLGDRKPTQLYRRMQQLLGDNQLEPSIMKQLFLQRLPTNAQLILASTKDDLDVQSLAKLADKILEISPTHPGPPTLSTVVPPQIQATPAPPTELGELRNIVAQLTTTISTLNLNLAAPQHQTQYPRPRSGSTTRRSTSPFHNTVNDGDTLQPGPPTHICWYHSKFGVSARKCSSPCSFPQQSLPSNYNARQ